MVVVILGHQLRSPDIHDQLRGRMEVGIQLFRATEDDWMVLSGGETNAEVSAAECDVMFDYAVDAGIGPSRIKRDNQALDTVGNGYFVRRLIDGLPDAEVVRVVSSCYHMDRVEYIFGQCFGPEYTVQTDHCHESDSPTDPDTEAEKLRQARDFFAPISPGDVDAIRERLVTAHALYDESVF